MSFLVLPLSLDHCVLDWSASTSQSKSRLIRYSVEIPIQRIYHRRKFPRVQLFFLFTHFKKFHHSNEPIFQKHFDFQHPIRTSIINHQSSHRHHLQHSKPHSPTISLATITTSAPWREPTTSFSMSMRHPTSKQSEKSTVISQESFTQTRTPATNKSQLSSSKR